MYTAEFDYHRPATLADAIAILNNNKDAKVLAGGHSLLPAMKLRVAHPPALVDIGRIADLNGIEAGDMAVKIGALATHNAVATAAAIAKACPILAETAALIGDQQVRNRGTLGGSVAHADPAADYPTVLVAMGATFTAQGAGGARDIPADQFFTDLFTTALQAGEILTGVTVPAYGNMPGMGGCYLKHRHPASSYAVVGVAAMVGLDGGKVARAAIVVGGATANPVHCAAAEAALTGQAPTAENIAAACGHVAAALKNTLSDHYASAEYRAHLATVMARRALAAAAQRAGA
jgi:carbon-monoxide dehydrogenase medium subunit